MRKTLLIMAFLLGCIGLSAQDYQLNLHNSGSVIYQNNVNAIEEIRFQNGNPANMLIYPPHFPIRQHHVHASRNSA